DNTGPDLPGIENLLGLGQGHWRAARACPDYFTRGWGSEPQPREPRPEVEPRRGKAVAGSKGFRGPQEKGHGAQSPGVGGAEGLEPGPFDADPREKGQTAVPNKRDPQGQGPAHDPFHRPIRIGLKFQTADTAADGVETLAGTDANRSEQAQSRNG